MAARSLQALSQLLRRAWGPIRSPSSNSVNPRLASQRSDGLTDVFSASMPGCGMSRTRGLSSCIGLASLRNFSVVGNGCLGKARSANLGRGAPGLLSYSSLALETREDSRYNAEEIGYKVLGPYVPDGAKIKPQSLFAVIQVGSHQFKVSAGDMIYTEKLKHADINDELSLNKVLLLGSLKQTVIGRPVIPDAAVIAAVEEHALDAKVIVFKKKRRKNYRRTNGHRQELTRLRILRIEGIEDSVPARVEASSGEDTD
ncbi:hypothetical protein R1flu_001606 [Riccia fluitans]|uniref:Large ribosomal subunit protein bL21m n=1 Tax=Riccia fluitans TaxID=41844 RepID=A0ABD1Y3R9_9MARC